MRSEITSCLVGADDEHFVTLKPPCRGLHPFHFQQSGSMVKVETLRPAGADEGPSLAPLSHRLIDVTVHSR